MDVGNLMSGSSAFSKSSLNIWKFMVHILLKPDLENFEQYFASVWDEYNCAVVWTFFGIAFLWDWNENWPFQACGHCWVFQICWHIDCSTFIASSLRIWDNSTGISLLPLLLFIVMLRPTWLHIPGCLVLGEWSHHHGFLGHEDPFCIILLCILATSSAYVRSIPFLFFIEPIFAWNIPSVSLIFLKRSLVFCILLFSSISLCWSLRKSFYLSLLFFGTLYSNGYIFPFLFSSFHSLLRQPFCLFAFLFLGDGLDPCLLYNVTNLHP